MVEQASARRLFFSVTIVASALAAIAIWPVPKEDTFHLFELVRFTLAASAALAFVYILTEASSVKFPLSYSRPNRVGPLAIANFIRKGCYNLSIDLYGSSFLGAASVYVKEWLKQRKDVSSPWAELIAITLLIGIYLGYLYLTRAHTEPKNE